MGVRIAGTWIKLRKLEGRLVRTCLFYLLRCFPINPRKVVFCVFRGNGYGDNPKYIAEEMVRQKLDYELVWLLRNENMENNNLPAEIRAVAVDSLRAIYDLVTARVWIDNHLKPLYVKKRKHQYYVQTSHGLPCLKKLEFENYIALSKIEAKKIDLFLSNSQWTSSVIDKDLWYKGEILTSGNPRNDVFFNADTSVQEVVRKSYNIARHQKMVLYAPTWRPNYDLSQYTFDVDMCLESLRERFSEDWVLMVRHHPAVHDRSLSVVGSRCVVDASEHEDMQELLATVDVVVTDYSSLMFDFALRRLPVFLHTPDIDEYRQLRGFYFNEDELPFSFARSNGELSDVIRKFNDQEYTKGVNDFFDRIGSYDSGHAASAVVSRIVALASTKKTVKRPFIKGIKPGQ